VRRLHESHPSWRLSTICVALSIPRSSFYYRTETRDDSALRQAITETAGDWPRYGSERITAQLRRDGFLVDGKPVGERRVRGLMRRPVGQAAEASHPHDKQQS
jgi:putative transposase